VDSVNSALDDRLRAFRYEQPSNCDVQQIHVICRENSKSRVSVACRRVVNVSGFEEVKLTRVGVQLYASLEQRGSYQ
jgi:hypothetical protein